MPNPQANDVFDFDGQRVRLIERHQFDQGVWIAHTVVGVNGQPRQLYIGQAWLDEHTRVGVADGPASAATSVTAGVRLDPATATPVPPVENITVTMQVAGAGGPVEVEDPAGLVSESEDRPVPRRRRAAPTRPPCPACGEQYTGELGTGHACADILAVRCMHCRSFNPAHLDAPPRPPYLCPTCVTAGVFVCKHCGNTQGQRGRYFDICNRCNPLPEGSVWEALGGKAQGNDMTIEVVSFRTYAVEIESFLMPNDAVSARGRVAPGWEEASDGSIRPDPGATETREFRSPPLKGDAGLRMLRDGVKKLRDMGFRANKTCGLHVHVGMVGSTPADRQSVYRFGQWIQDDIYKLVAKSRSTATYCKRLGNSMEAEDRYKWLNMKHAFERHGTVEFRLHHGTTQPDRIAEWVKVCLRIVEGGLKMGRMQVRPAGSMMDLLGFTPFEKRYWTDVAHSLHGSEVQFTGGR